MSGNSRIRRWERVKAAARLVVLVFLAFSCIAGLKCCVSKLAKSSLSAGEKEKGKE